jgi:methylmalonic aciduria homocystinuria type C protein
VKGLDTLTLAGFDIVHTFDTAALAETPGFAMLAGDARLGILIGNTRALWPPFTAALHDPNWSDRFQLAAQQGSEAPRSEGPAGAAPVLATERDPLDRYTERVIDAAFPGARRYYGHRRYDEGFVPLQRLAAATGLGALAPTHLVIHPIYGPWFALRAVVVMEGEPPLRTPIPKPCHCDASCSASFARARQSKDWRDWLAVRDSCTLGAWRYGDEQVHYHYSQLTHPPGEISSYRPVPVGDSVR